MKRLLLPALFIFLSACSKTESAAPTKPAPQAAKEAAGLKNRSIVGDITATNALELLYGGKLDPRHKAVSWVAQNVSKSEASSLSNGDKVWVSALLAEKTREGNEEKFYLLTSIVPADKDSFDGLESAPILGAAVFIKRGDHWDVEIQHLAVMAAGSRGEPPQPALTAIGPNRHGFLLTGFYMDAGISLTRATLLAPQGKGFQNIFDLQTGEENRVICEKHDDDPPTCYDYSTSIDFRPGSHADYYDIIATTHGTQPDENALEVKGDHLNVKKVVDATAATTYRFNGNKYLPLPIK